MSFYSAPGAQSDASSKVDIIGIPAIGANPIEAFNSLESVWLGPALSRKVPEARVLLYDHLLPEERAASRSGSPSRQDDSSSPVWEASRRRLSGFGIEEWSNRLLGVLYQCRNTRQSQQRPIMFIAHSTGGIILKAALVKKLPEVEVDLIGVCIGVTFFATPHHGSRALSRPEFARPIQEKFRLKWEMGERLRSQITLQNAELEFLNHAFGSLSLGIRIWSYLETRETQLKVKTDFGETTVPQFIVDPQSAEMTNSIENDLVEEEDVYYLNTSHAGTARLGDDAGLIDDYTDAVRDLVQSTSPQDRADHHELIQTIFSTVKVDIHQFYRMESTAGAPETKVWIESASLRAFLDSGPSRLLKKRLSATEQRSPWSGTFGPTSAPSPASPFTQTPPAMAAEYSRPWPDNIVPRTEKLLSPEVVSWPLPPSEKDRGNARDTELRTLNPFAVSTIPIDGSPRQPAPGSAQPSTVHTFQVPTKDTDKFVWIHVPACVSGFVPKIMSSISRDKGEAELHEKLLMDQLWMAHHNKSRHASSHAYFVRPFCKALIPKGTTHDELLAPSSASHEMQPALFLPYLHWDTFEQFKRRAAIIARRNRQQYARPVDRHILSGNSLEHKLIWQFLNSRSPIHCRRTTDQYGYSTLRNTKARDEDQVMYKQTLKNMSDPTVHEIQGSRSRLAAAKRQASRAHTVGANSACMLMVDQLWLWILADDTILTFATPKDRTDSDRGAHLQADIRKRIYDDVHGDYPHPVEDCFDFAALTVFHCIKALLEHTENPNLQVFRIFEEFISELTEAQVNSFKYFQNSHRINDPKGEDLTPQFFDNSADLDALLELRDIKDELNTIHKLLTEQYKTVGDMISQYETDVNTRGKGLRGTVLLRDTEHAITVYLQQVDGMLKSSKVAEDAFEQLLDMKQKHANIVEAHLSREQAQVAAEQSRSVMIFTIFTVIFLPLSFFASIFGMNAREWSGVSTNPRMNDILKYMGSISLGVIVIALLIAFNRHTRRALRALWHSLASPIARVRSRKEDSKTKNRVSTSDSAIWADHKC